MTSLSFVLSRVEAVSLLLVVGSKQLAAAAAAKNVQSQAKSPSRRGEREREQVLASYVQLGQLFAWST